eukprot:3362418-Prymnesium_polylepis.1
MKCRIIPLLLLLETHLHLKEQRRPQVGKEDPPAVDGGVRRRVGRHQFSLLAILRLEVHLADRHHLHLAIGVSEHARLLGQNAVEVVARLNLLLRRQ